MKFNEIMHLSFYTDQLDVMRDFYENKLGLKTKIIMRYEAYKGKEDRGYWAKMAESDPEYIASQDFCESDFTLERMRRAEELINPRDNPSFSAQISEHIAP